MAGFATAFYEEELLPDERKRGGCNDDSLVDPLLLMGE